MTRVSVNQIIPFSTVDGPGSRTSTLLQKCNTTCGYCHSPETQSLCNNYGVCVPRCLEGALFMVDGVAAWDESKCVSYDTCIEVCPYHASPKIRRMDAPAVMKKVEKNTPLIHGTIVSGGECRLYPQSSQELFMLARTKGLTCLLDNNSTVRFSKYPELVKVYDGMMLDVKTWSPGVFWALTGGDNAIAKGNLLSPSSYEKLGEVRIVNVEGHVDVEDAICGTAELPDPLTDNMRLPLISFRNNGVKGPFTAFSSPSTEKMKQLTELTVSTGFRNVIVKQW